MQGLKLKRIFRRHVANNPVASYVQLLFHTLWDEFDEAYWPENLSRRDALLCEKMQMSENALRTSRNTLKQIGFINFTSGKCRGKPTVYHMSKPSSEAGISEGNGEGISEGNDAGDRAGDSAYKIHIPKTYNLLSKPTPDPAGACEPKKNLDGFDEFWAAYPKRVGKGEAERAWSRLRPDGELRARMTAAIGAMRGTDDWTKEGGRFIPNPSTWLGQRRWEDDIPQNYDDKAEIEAMLDEDWLSMFP